MDFARHGNVPHSDAHGIDSPAFEPIGIMMATFLLLTPHPIEGLFLGSGKAGVVVGVAAMILVGLLIWMFRAHRQLNRMDERLTSMEHNPKGAKGTPITPKQP